MVFCMHLGPYCLFIKQESSTKVVSNVVPGGPSTFQFLWFSTTEITTIG